MNTTPITIEAYANAGAEETWDRYTNPEHIVNWNFASPDWTCPWAENDLQAGGKYKARMEAKDGSFGFDFGGTYTEVDQPKKLVYKLDDGRMVETRFEEVEGRTKITTTFDPEQQNSAEMQRMGWQAILNNFAEYAGK